MTPDRFEELESLLLNWEDDTLDDAGVERVREILRTDEDARAHFVRLQMLNAALKTDDDAGLLEQQTEDVHSVYTEDVPLTVKVVNVSRFWPNRRWIFAAVTLMFAVLAGRVVQLELASRVPDSEETKERGGTIVTVNDRDESKEATSQGVALITRLVDVSWSDNQSPLEVGDALSPGRFEIASGYAQLEFFCGATVILEGPAELDLQSPLLARVRRGTLRAQVPPAARGFSLEVDDMTVVDLGTEFGLSVTDKGANVQVFDGEVELQQPETAKRLLTAGKALLRNADGSYESAKITPDSFLDIDKLESRAQGQEEARYERWKNWSMELRRDPRLIACYAFDEKGGWSRRLSNSLVPLKKAAGREGSATASYLPTPNWTAQSWGLVESQADGRVKAAWNSSGLEIGFVSIFLENTAR